MGAVRSGLLAVVLLAWLHGSVLAGEAAVSVQAAAGGCPGGAEVAASLESRLPGVTRARRGSQPVRYRLEIGRDAEGVALALRLRDEGGAPLLERQLNVSPPAATRSPSAEVCQALAETAALVVARYLREIGYRSPTPVLPPDEPAAPARADASPAVPEAPPTTAEETAGPADAVPSATEAVAAGPSAATAPPPPAARSASRAAAAPAGRVLAARAAPSASATASGRSGGRAPASALLLAAGGATRLGFSGGAADASRPPARTDLLVGLQGNRGWIAGELAAGASTETAIRVPRSGGTASLRLRAFPVRAALGIPLSLAAGVILPAVAVNLDLLSFRARGLIDAQSGLRVEPSAELGLAYRAGGRRLFVRGSLWGGLSLSPRDFDAGGSEPVFRTPAAYLRLALEVGLALWKN
jgi:hypothetical protein